MVQEPMIRQLRQAHVLVLAAQFPVLNQPWMDTYLQQLDAADLSFAVFSKQVARWKYNEKVDKLGFLQVRVVLEDRAGVLALACWATLARRPLVALRSVAAAWQRYRSEPSVRSRVGAVLRGTSVASAAAKLPALRVIHSHSLQMGYEAIAVSDIRSLPIVLTFHGLEPSGVRQVPENRRLALFAQAACVLVNTDFARHHAMQLGCPAHKLRVLPQGLPLEDFPFHSRQMPGANEPLELLSVGRFHRDKGQRYSLIALARLRREGFDARWHFAGVGPDHRKLEALATRLGVRPFVSFHEAISAEALKDLYRRCHLFVLASIGSKAGAEHMETQGVVLQEAQASGCIPIATRTGGIPECITDGHDGLLVEERSHRAIANAIRFLLQHPERWPEWQQNGRRTVEERFSADVIGRRMAALLQEVAGPLVQERGGTRDTIPSKS